MIHLEPAQRGRMQTAATPPTAVTRGSSASTGATPVTGLTLPASDPVQFGSAGNRMLKNGMNAVLPVFQNISEVFLLAYLVQDGVSMILPRIIKGTLRGREKYEPSADPHARDLPMKDQLRLWLVKNFQGLNWAQSREEVVREAFAGPGLLVLLGSVLGVGTKLFGNSAMGLSAPSLNGLAKGFASQAEKAEKALKPGESLVPRDLVARHLDSLFADKGFRSSHDAFLKDWVERWVQISEQHPNNLSARVKALAPLGAELEKKVWDYNRQHRMLPYAASDIRGLDTLDDAARRKLGVDASGQVTRNIHRGDQLWVRMNGKTSQKSASALVQELTRFSDFTSSVAEKVTQDAGKSWSKVTRQALERLITRKFFVGAAVTALGTFYITQVSKWSQSNDSYEANRQMQLGGGGAAPPAKPQAGGPHA